MLSHRRRACRDANEPRQLIVDQRKAKAAIDERQAASLKFWNDGGTRFDAVDSDEHEVCLIEQCKRVWAEINVMRDDTAMHASVDAGEIRDFR